MFFLQFIRTVSVLFLIAALPGALASPSPKHTARKNTVSTRVTPEVYSALEDSEIITAPTNPPKIALPPPKYEEVPVAKRSQVMKRMELCQHLFEVSGRAYDYRSMTTAELEKEYTALQKVKRTVTLRQESSGLFRPVESAQALPPPPQVEKDPILDAE